MTTTGEPVPGGSMENARNMPNLDQALYELCIEMAAIWQEPRLLGSSWKSLPKIVVTLAEEGGPILPQTKRPIRGHNKVTTNVREGKLQGSRLAEHLIGQAFFDPRGYPDDDPSIIKARALLNDKLNSVLSAFEKIGHLPERLFEASGFKHYEPDEVRRFALEGSDFMNRRLLWKLRLAESLGKALASMSFDPARMAEFDKWKAVAEAVADDFKALASRRRNRYRALTLLNSPLVDQEGTVPIAYLAVDDEPIEVCLSGATDDFLTELVRQTSGVPLDQVNTVISFDFTVDVDARVETYLAWYPQASFLAERSVDLLRLVCGDDVGVLALEIIELDWATPGIRKTYENSYRIDLAPYQPKRFRFSPPSEQILLESQIAQLQRLTPPYVTGEIDVKGLGTAMRRFRASFDRYSPSDPERLLEGVWEAPKGVLKCVYGIPEQPQRHAMANYPASASCHQAWRQASCDRSPVGGQCYLLHPAQRLRVAHAPA